MEVPGVGLPGELPGVGLPGEQPQASDPKTELNQFCQRFCQRPVTKTDIVYVTSKFGHQFGYQFQAIVKLNCLEGQEYAGNLSPSPKEAEKSAAQEALAAYASQMLAAPGGQKGQDPSFPDMQAEAKQPEDGDNPAITPKTKLNTLCMRIAKRYLQKGETLYECRKVPGGYQATVKLSALPGDWKDRLWAGQVFTTKQKAEQSAAEIALMQISEDDELSEEALKPKGSGKGKGKGKAAGKGKGKEWGKGWGWSWRWQDAPSGPNLPRERVAEAQILGEVIEWKETYGWLKAVSEIDHPAAQLRDGKIYTHQQDLGQGLESLSASQQVKFYLYVDPSGLGAEEVELV